MPERIPELVRRAFAWPPRAGPARSCWPARGRLARRGRARPRRTSGPTRRRPRVPARRARPAAARRRAGRRPAGQRRAPADPRRRRHPPVRRRTRRCWRSAEPHGIPVAHTLSGKGAIPCTHRLSVGAVRPLQPHRQRADRGVRLPARGRLQARRDRDQALRAAARRHAADPPRRRCRGDRSHWTRADGRRCGATRAAGLEDPRRGAARPRAADAAPTSRWSGERTTGRRDAERATRATSARSTWLA